ncbi:MAG: glycoside hydrolase family 3 N-terminal domain-containing protein [Desulfomonilaceae bacterium]|nr:glycoside hydrolase family 3 N-terminal domain-containing protein [Desulfomonilaceae bacterium]
MTGNGAQHDDANRQKLDRESLNSVHGHAKPIRPVRVALTAFLLAAAVALVPLALDWRSPLLAVVRPWAMIGLIVVPAVVILAHAWILRSSPREHWWLRVLSAVGIVAAATASATTLALESRFHWVRYQVLHTDPAKLERVGRHLFVGYRDLEEVRDLVKLRGVAGVFVSAANVQGKSISEIRRDIDSLQAIRKEQGLPRLWIATDQEGGIVSRLSPPLTRLPPLSAVVASSPHVARQQQAIRKYALTQGRGLAGVGVNLNFAPVLDVNHKVMNPDDRFTRIHERAISGDPAVVAQVATWYCKALEETGVRCTLKHFPGLGRVFEDTHTDHAYLETSIAELGKTDWVPFRRLMQETDSFTMLSHVKLKAIDADRPVSASPAVIAGLIRKQWNYNGVLITDNFTMMAIYRSSGGMEYASIQALNAGVDLILVSWDVDQYYRVAYALLKADERGDLDRHALKLSEQRLAHAIDALRE